MVGSATVRIVSVLAELLAEAGGEEANAPQGQGSYGQGSRAEDESRPSSSGRRRRIPHTASSNPCCHVLTSFHRIVGYHGVGGREDWARTELGSWSRRSEEHTSELQ